MAHGPWYPFGRYGNLDSNHTSVDFVASRSSSRRVGLSVLPLLSLPLHSLAKSDPVPAIFPPTRSVPFIASANPRPSGERERGPLPAVEVKVWQDLRYALDADPNSSTNGFC